MASSAADAGRDELLEEIDALIEPELNGTRRPFFSVEELAVISIVVNHNRDWKYAFRWLLETFCYWTAEALDFVSYGEGNRFPHSVELFRSDFKRALTSLEVPIQRNSNVPVYEHDGFDDAAWSVSTTAARAFLGLCVIPPITVFRRPNLSAAARNAKQFRFLDLPSELREKIYAYALDLPTSGVAFEKQPQRDDSANGPRLIAQTKSLSSTSETRNWFPKNFDRARMSMKVSLAGPKSFIEGPHLSQHLALSRVNRQVNDEALAYFYKHTHVVFRTFEDLQEFLDKTPKDRRDMIRHMSLILHPREHRTNDGRLCTKVLATMKILKAMKLLRELDIWMWGSVFDRVWTNGKKWKDLAMFPGVVGLRAMRGLKKVTVHGDCDGVKAILEKEMLMENGARKKRVSKKRAADGEGQDEEEPRVSKKAA